MINSEEAEVVRRIFRDYVVGKSAKRISVELNRDGIAAPGGGNWGFSTISGNTKRCNGILNNEMYIGRAHVLRRPGCGAGPNERTWRRSPR
ncbi:recombinase family protein [Bradyrhizobium hipponense]|uniref:recombinase family protein n=1 Tax=Bradyrhizobium hipponense TaxID=2605638 RepID=UPI003D31E2D0